MILRLMMAFVIISLHSVFASVDITKKVWSDNQGDHAFIIKREWNDDKGEEYLIIKQTTNGKNIWILKDYVKNCDVDIKLDVIKESVEVNKKISNDDSTILFAYKIGCVGGIDPVTIKYFAYSNGVKYALRGEEHIIIGADSFGGEKIPVPNYNLINNIDLLNYMLKKWGAISTTRIN